MLTDGCWSPTRPSLFFTSRTDGWMEAWDIIENQRTPVLTHKVQIENYVVDSKPIFRFKKVQLIVWQLILRVSSCALVEILVKCL